MSPSKIPVSTSAYEPRSQMCVYTILFIARRMKTYRDRDRNRHADRILKLTSGVIIRNNKEYLMLRDPETDTQTKKRAETIN